MLSRAFTKPKRSTNKHAGGEAITQSESILNEYEDCIVGFMDDIPLVVCNRIACWPPPTAESSFDKPTLREVLRASVGVMGESSMGITEKLVFLGGKVCALKRFRIVKMRRREFGRRLERLAQISRMCEYLVPVSAYLYSKRLKFVLCDYFPMGSLSDLLAGGRDCGHTALNWDQRRKILFTVAQAIHFIHTKFPSREQRMLMNVHGNIKASNIMVNVDFTACLSEYGFAQLAERVEVSATSQQKPSSSLTAGQEAQFCEDLSQKGDIYDFGAVMLDILVGPKGHQDYRKCIQEKMEEIRDGRIEFFDFSVEGEERGQALQILEIALAFTNKVAEARPSIEQLLGSFGNAF